MAQGLVIAKALLEIAHLGLPHKQITGSAEAMVAKGKASSRRGLQPAQVLVV